MFVPNCHACATPAATGTPIEYAFADAASSARIPLRPRSMRFVPSANAKPPPSVIPCSAIGRSSVADAPDAAKCATVEARSRSGSAPPAQFAASPTAPLPVHVAE